MGPTDALTALVIILLIVVAYYQYRGWCKSASAGGKTEGFTPEPENPRTTLNRELDIIEGYRNTGFRQPPVYDTARGLETLARSKVTPAQMQLASNEMYYATRGVGSTPQFEAEHAFDQAAEITEHFDTSKPASDYVGMVTDSILDSRARDNHKKWVEEMLPWSGTASTVDDLDVEPQIHFVGLRRPQAVAQYNPLFITEIGPEDLAVNPAHWVI